MRVRIGNEAEAHDTIVRSDREGKANQDQDEQGSRSSHVAVSLLDRGVLEAQLIAFLQAESFDRHHARFHIK